MASDTGGRAAGGRRLRRAASDGRTVASETGDRAAFLGRLRDRLAGGVPANPVHPMPPAPATVPNVVPVALDRGDLVGAFERAVVAVGAVVHRSLDGDWLADLVRDAGVRSAVTTPEPEAIAAGEVLAGLGVAVAPYDRQRGAAADLGVTGAVAAIAATGSVVVDAAVAGGRGASLLPGIHLCVVPVDRLVATPADVLRPLAGTQPSSALTIITGPSRTGDIEQLLTMGVHGPVAVHVVLLGA